MLIPIPARRASPPQGATTVGNGEPMMVATRGGGCRNQNDHQPLGLCVQVLHPCFVIKLLKTECDCQTCSSVVYYISNGLTKYFVKES